MDFGAYQGEKLVSSVHESLESRIHKFYLEGRGVSDMKILKIEGFYGSKLEILEKNR